MIRGLVEDVQTLTDRCCPLPEKYKQLATSTNPEDRRLSTRLEGFAYCYMIVWTLLQLMLFVALMIVFYNSHDNYFMATEDCCYATEVLTRTNNDLPLKQCSNLACPLQTQNASYYDAIWNEANEELTDNRPRHPKHGDYSIIFAYHQQHWCCNLNAETTKCCNKMPYDINCALVMWLAGFSAVCAVLMTQVMLQGFYSYCSRRGSVWILSSVCIGILLRLVLFCVMFYFFFGFMFLFIFFWLPMVKCDNPYAFEWWKFGYLYVYFFFEKLGQMLSSGFNKIDQEMNFEQLISSHSTLSVFVDFIFSVSYIFLARLKDSKGQPYFHLTFFKL